MRRTDRRSSPNLLDELPGLGDDVGSGETHDARHLHGVPAGPRETASSASEPRELLPASILTEPQQPQPLSHASYSTDILRPFFGICYIFIVISVFIFYTLFIFIISLEQRNCETNNFPGINKVLILNLISPNISFLAARVQVKGIMGNLNPIHTNTLLLAAQVLVQCIMGWRAA